MYLYDKFDKEFLNKRAFEFRSQVNRRLDGKLSEDEFKPLRLMNGLYLQLHSYMLRVAIPYGVISSKQFKILAEIARRYDKGFGHFTTRQNIQYNWIKLEDAPDIIDLLASVDMHAIQTSGNCIRNVTTDAYAGVIKDEIYDPRAYAEIIRQWSTLHPEFTFLPRKFKIAITGSEYDRAALYYHDIGIQIVSNYEALKAGISKDDISDNRDFGFKIIVGGGQGRTPVIGKVIKNYLKEEHLLSYLEAILSVYNRYGRRDNIYKARIKILVNAIGIDEFKTQCEDDWNKLNKDNYNIDGHYHPSYAIVNIVLKGVGRIAGDMSADEMDKVAKLAELYSNSEIRVTHKQNLVLPYVKKSDLKALYLELKKLELVNAYKDLANDVITCPGLDYCALANARSIPLSNKITNLLENNCLNEEAGKIRINISGCINACGHHHIGNIGILGVDMHGKEAYQITLGGDGYSNPQIGKILGSALNEDDAAEAIIKIIQLYIEKRNQGENFLQTYKRIGKNPFKERIYDNI